MWQGERDWLDEREDVRFGKVYIKNQGDQRSTGRLGCGVWERNIPPTYVHVTTRTQYLDTHTSSALQSLSWKL
jgi:hypothetical protein